MSHYSPQEFVDAADGTLVGSRSAHLDTCESCRSEVLWLRSITTETRGAEAFKDPSPLFWPHFAARVRAATDSEAVRAARAWWVVDWRFAAVALTVTSAAWLAVLSVGTPVVQLPEPAGDIAAGPMIPGPASAPADIAALLGRQAAAPEAIQADSAIAWTRLLESTSGGPVEDALTVPRASSAVVLIEDLSQAELREFVRLLRAESGGTW